MSVQPTSKMSDETFCKHMDARHTPIAGLTSVRYSTGADYGYLRAYHDAVHRSGHDDTGALKRPVNHEHSDG